MQKQLLLKSFFTSFQVCSFLFNTDFLPSDMVRSQDGFSLAYSHVSAALHYTTRHPAAPPPHCLLPRSLHIVNQRQSPSELRSFCVLSALCLIVFPIAFALMDLLPFIISLLWTLVLPSRHLMWRKRPFFAELEKLGSALLGFFPSLSGLTIPPSSHGFYRVSSSPA